MCYSIQHEQLSKEMDWSTSASCGSIIIKTGTCQSNNVIPKIVTRTIRILVVAAKQQLRHLFHSAFLEVRLLFEVSH